MMERLINQRQFLYRIEKTSKGNNVKMQNIYRFKNIPHEMQDLSLYPFFFSPNFMRYIDIDRKKKIFVIRDTLNNEISPVDIPEYIMDFKEWMLNP